MTHRVLVIEPEAEVQTPPLNLVDSDFPAHFTRASWIAFDPEQSDSPRPDLIVAVDVPQTPAFAGFLEWLRTHPQAKPVFGVISQAAPESLVRTASQMLDDFILWPATRPEIECRIRRLLGAAAPEEPNGTHDPQGADRALSEHPALRALVGESPIFRKVVSRIPRVADTDAPVLITGETGTGKELAARAIHRLSRRQSGPFIPVDCSALPENLFENEMFGHERGAFTDAHRSREGLVALAQGGTLFLDEIDSLGPGVQAKLLRLLQEKTYRPLGSERFRQADLRVLAASNRDLEDAVRRQQLRSDLFFRLDVLRLHLPPLRERAGDVAVLAGVFLKTLTPQGVPRRAFRPRHYASSRSTTGPEMCVSCAPCCSEPSSSLRVPKSQRRTSRFPAWWTRRGTSDAPFARRGPRPSPRSRRGTSTTCFGGIRATSPGRHGRLDTNAGPSGEWRKNTV